MRRDRLPDPAKTIEISPDEVEALAAQIESGEILLLDCREEDEWKINRLPGARLVPLSEFATKAAALMGEGNDPCIIYCHHGMRSLRAAEWLRSHGHTNSWSMAGGIHAWAEMVDPSVPKY